MPGTERVRAATAADAPLNATRAVGPLAPADLDGAFAPVPGPGDAGPVDAGTVDADAANGHGGGNGHQGGNGHHASPALRRDIVLWLRQVGPSSPDQVAAHLGASRTGVLQQLRSLETAELVTRRTERHGVGRPRHLYDVTAQAQDLFPSNYEGLASGLLAAIDAVGGEELVAAVFEARRRQAIERIRERLDGRLAPDAPLAERVRELAVIQDEQGYLAAAEVDTDGTIRLTEHNCAILGVARGTPAACQAELELIAEVLGAEVVRERHIAAGDRCCAYRVIAGAGAD